MNEVTLCGRLGADPEFRETTTGQKVANFNLATNERWTDKSGQKQEKTEWHRIVVWNRTAEICAQYLKKGSQVLLKGKLQTRSWDDKDGNKKYTTEIIATGVEFLGGGTQNTNTTTQQNSQPFNQGPVNEDIPF